MRGRVIVARAPLLAEYASEGAALGGPGGRARGGRQHRVRVARRASSGGLHRLLSLHLNVIILRSQISMLSIVNSAGVACPHPSAANYI